MAQVVIQGEAKNLEGIHVDVIEIFRFALNDMIVYNRLYED